MNTSYHRSQKSLGQNFLVDGRMQQRIVEACALQADEVVVEIGPGKGAITRRICPLVKGLIAVEKDRSLAALLAHEFQQPQVKIVQADFLKWDMSLLPEGVVVVGNIPYYISTPIIEKILAHKDKIRRAFLTVQLEFGLRLAATAGGKDYGSLSCFVQYYADVQVLFKISRHCFNPQPKVNSCFVSLTMKSKPEVAARDERQLFNLIQKAFTQRRKTIVNALKKTVGQERLMDELQRLGIDLQSRPEDLTLLNYIKLSNTLVV
ncbi:MAG: ribosomal RNA small subunit methyltransferase A [Candidatus Omnitrophica bacterium]|nr:ribosomal RNA small subunit methyltransferase A [Candidatus Omnitrophota bacterium]